MARPIVALLTDFGTSDHYVGAMKGVILGICPLASIVDISHEVPPYQTTEGAFLLAQAYPHFPPGTVHVVVVDPGVGTARRPILAQAAGQYFVAPDNGVLSMVYSREEKRRVRAITAARYFHHPVSRTFHGRDVFAPVGAHIAAGVPAARMGKLIEDYFRRDFERPVQTGKRFWSGTVLHIDRFGNLVTNFRMAGTPGLNLEGRPFDITLGPYRIAALAPSYEEAGPGELFVIEGSSGYLEISLKQASAANMIRCQAGAPVELTTY